MTQTLEVPELQAPDYTIEQLDIHLTFLAVILQNTDNRVKRANTVRRADHWLDIRLEVMKHDACDSR